MLIPHVLPALDARLHVPRATVRRAIQPRKWAHPQETRRLMAPPTPSMALRNQPLGEGAPAASSAGISRLTLRATELADIPPAVRRACGRWESPQAGPNAIPMTGQRRGHLHDRDRRDV